MLKRKNVEGNQHISVKILLIIIILSALGGISAGIKWQQNRTENAKANVKITSDLLEQQLQQMSELSTVKYLYTNMGKYENTKQILNHDVPLTTKSFTISYDGTIKAGINLDQITFEIENYEITVLIPKAEVLSNDVDMDSVTVYDEKSSIFNGLSTTDVTDFLSGQEDKMEEKAINSGLLDEAEDSAVSVITSFLTSFLTNGSFDKEYSLHVETKEE